MVVRLDRHAMTTAQDKTPIERLYTRSSLGALYEERLL